MDIINQINATRFLGREFLTWLWYRTTQQDGIFELTEGPIELWFDAQLTMESGRELKESSVVKAESPTETSEAHAALVTGKQVSLARLRIVSGQKQWTVTVKGDSLALSSMKIPALLSREDDDQLYERFMLIEELEDIVARLFEIFVTLRVEEDAWRKEVHAIRKWVHDKEEFA